MADRGQVLTLIFFFSFLLASAQPGGEKTYPFVRNYSHADFRASSMNYGVVRDSLGIMYIANEDGVLVYDGYHWELVPIAENKPVYWVEVGYDGVPYVGSSGEFGYLVPEHGQLRYVSLLDRIDTAYHDFEVVWEIGKTSRQLGFRSKKYLFVLENDSITVVPKKNRGFDVLYPVRDVFLVRERGIGLCQWVGDSLALIPGGEFFADMKLNIYLPYGKDEVLVGTRKNGLFICGDGRVRPFVTEADTIFLRGNIYHGSVTLDGNYALASSTSGVAVVDPQGKLLRFLGPDSGLPDNQYLSVAALDEENLWMATGRGVSKVAVNSPLTHVDYNFGLKDMVKDIIRYKDNLYLATLYGLFQLTEEGIRQVNEKDYQEISSLDLLGDRLLIGAQSRLISYNGKAFKPLADSRETREIKVSEDQTKIFAAIGEGHFGVYYKKNKSYELTTLEGFVEPVSKILEFDDHIVLSTTYGNLFIVKMTQENQGLQLNITHSYRLGSFDMTKIDGELLVFKPDECFKVNMEGRIYHRTDHDFGQGLKRINKISEVKDGKLWVCYENDQRINYCEYIGIANGEIQSRDFKFKTDFRIATILADGSEITWFGGAGGLLKYDLGQAEKLTKTGFECHIKRVVWNGDSVVHSIYEPIERLSLDYENSSLSFELLTNQAAQSHEVQFQYWMEGMEERWSDWTTEPLRNYDHMHHGSYTFHVRAKNGFNQICEETTFEFDIEAPFYKSPVAIGGYFILFLGLVYAAFVWGMASVDAARKKLEEKVRERTAEVEDQKEVLNQANKTKDQLFSIIGHDLRSPLNSLHSLTELIQHYQQEMNPEKVDELIKTMSDSVDNLRNLLDNLLSWTLTQSGNLELRAIAIELKPFLENIVKMLSDSAKKKEITIELEVEVKATFIGDKNTLAVIVRNLLSNAIKFTRPQGVIRIKAFANIVGLELSVEDNGVGISNDRLEDVFELSHSSYGTAYEKGTGIGLSLVRDFVHMHNGEIKVESKLDLGSKFSFFLPKLDN